MQVLCQGDCGPEVVSGLVTTSLWSMMEHFRWFEHGVMYYDSNYKIHVFVGLGLAKGRISFHSGGSFAMVEKISI